MSSNLFTKIGIPLNNLDYDNCELSSLYRDESAYSFGLNKVALRVIQTPPIDIHFDQSLVDLNYSPGSSVPIRLVSTPDSGNFMVKLSCGSSEPAVRLIISNTESSQSFLIPDNFYGTNCAFTVDYPINSSNTIQINII